MPEKPQRNFAGLARSLGQRIKQRLGVDFSLQDHCAPV
jgi:hypothetical protein